WADLPRALMSWTQNAGTLAALAALVWFAATYLGRKLEKRRLQASPLATGMLLLSWSLFGVVLGIMLLNWSSDGRYHNLVPSTPMTVDPADPNPPPQPPPTLSDWLLTAAGALALVVVAAPMLRLLAGGLRWGRILALARLGFKEGIRSRVVLVFAAIVPLLLFAGWFITGKPEDQIRNYVDFLYLVITILFILTTSLIGSLGIPADVKSQAIHTIVTKPVEKLEIVLGRYLGYAALITMGLVLVTALSMIYLLRNLTPESIEESYRARVPIYGRLEYIGTKERRGDNVGREYDIRGYITGPQVNQPNLPRQFAIWSFDTLPDSVGADGKPVAFEFGFDIFRLTKGIENQGVLCTFYFADGRIRPMDLERRKLEMDAKFDELQEAAVKKHGGDRAALNKALADIRLKLLHDFGMYVKPKFNVTDYHTQRIDDVPAALFEYLRKKETTEPRQAVGNEPAPPMFQVGVSVDFDIRGANQQMLGTARRDLYLLVTEQSFLLNYIKGIVGLWCLLMLVLGIAVTCSAYLSGVISWLCTIFIVLAGLFVADIQEIAENRSPGGGPLESLTRIALKQNQVVDLGDSPAATLRSGVDEAIRWLLRVFFLRLIPDVWRFDLHNYVSNGFDIALSVLCMETVLPMLGFLFPCAVFAYYLMKYREIANPS
ncbi:MAG: hypothetical protein NZO58_08585, partial [Gemmataceae bacterium]|nr:hypothetical protein [Gemmataceae bacterium]